MPNFDEELDKWNEQVQTGCWSKHRYPVIPSKGGVDKDSETD